MVSYNHSCRLCFDNIADENVQIINNDVQDMLQTVLINIHLSTTEVGVICKMCHEKLEKNYCFKKKCVFTEDTISPFVIENVKMNLNEVRNQIIKTEGAETDKNVCRLCLQYNDDDMTLTKDEQRQFEVLFPEINSNLTNFVVLCLSCYNTLHKYFMFVTSCSRNIGEVDAKKTVLLKEEVEIKSEEASSDLPEELLCSNSIDCNVKQIGGVKSEETSSTNESDDDKKLILHEEVDIKPDEDSMDTGCCTGRLLFDDFSDSKCDAINCRMEDCNGQQKDKITIHTDPAKIRMYQCIYRRKLNNFLKKHILNNNADCPDNHPDSPKIYECNLCDFKSKYSRHVKNHVTNIHTDPSNIRMIKCEYCSFECKQSKDLKSHVRNKHTDPSKIQMYECNDCNYRSKYSNHLKRHVTNKHFDPSKIQMYECNDCDYKSKSSSHLKRHMNKHIDPSEIQMYECKDCNYKSKRCRDLKRHVLNRHTDPSKVQMYGCDYCNYKTKYSNCIKRHVRDKHTDPSKIQTYECNDCNFKCKWSQTLKRHIKNKHTDPSKI